MRGRGKRLSIVSSAFCCCVIAGLGQAAEISSGLAMPKGFEDIKLGMTLGELKQARPDLRKDDWPVVKMYFEELGGRGFYDTVTYFFDVAEARSVRSQDRLSAVVFSKHWTARKGAASAIARQLEELIEKWGRDFQKSVRPVGNSRHVRKLTIYRWEGDGVTAELCITGEEEKPEEAGYIELRIYQSGRSRNPKADSEKSQP